ncbi:MAG: hypothetical protein V2I97_02330 [Desulfococcaceae bacterium]|jgi:hypothetical protein|nr:hypothetical protein [Desulfococcaceae bacterium]
MEMTIEIPDKDLIEFGRESVYREIKNTLKWMKIKNSFRKISKELRNVDKKDYYNELEAIRESAWNEYKKDIL